MRVMELGRIGIWSFQLRDAREGMREAAAGLNEADEPADHRDLPMAHLLPESHHRRDPNHLSGRIRTSSPHRKPLCKPSLFETVTPVSVDCP